jgi:hypothetical protein
MIPAMSEGVAGSLPAAAALFTRNRGAQPAQKQLLDPISRVRRGGDVRRVTMAAKDW